MSPNSETAMRMAKEGKLAEALGYAQGRENAAKEVEQIEALKAQATLTVTAPNGDTIMCHGSAVDMMTLDKVVKAQAVPSGWKLVPVEPTEAQWGELARDIVFWYGTCTPPHHGAKLHTFLRNMGRVVPHWLIEEINDSDSTPAKGTVAAVIYKAMLEAAPAPEA